MFFFFLCVLQKSDYCNFESTEVIKDDRVYKVPHDFSMFAFHIEKEWGKWSSYVTLQLIFDVLIYAKIETRCTDMTRCTDPHPFT